MRKYILTPREQNILEAYLEDGLKLEGYTTLRNRIIELSPQLVKCLVLLARFWIKENLLEPFSPSDDIRNMVGFVAGFEYERPSSGTEKTD